LRFTERRIEFLPCFDDFSDRFTRVEKRSVIAWVFFRIIDSGFRFADAPLLISEQILGSFGARCCEIKR
jgi:hypothetical protein